MRIISGEARGRKLRTLDVPHLRPMLDRVRVALFSIIRERIPGARVLDLFSGCGALGIETLSRGAERCLFVEHDPKLVKLIEQNLEMCRMTERAATLRMDFLFLANRRPPAGFECASLVFADPPYAMVEDPNVRAELLAGIERLIGQWIAPGATVMLHHKPAPYMLWPTKRLRCFDRRVYGNSQITLFQVEEAAGGKA